MAQEHFEQIADAYDSIFKPHIFNHYASRRVELFESLCPTAGRILDYGCGTGVLAERLSRRGFDVRGTEYSANMFQKAMERGVRGGLLNDGQIPFGDDQFDLVYCVAVFHHLETPAKVRQAVREMVRVAKPAGNVVVWDHNPLNPFWPALMRRWPQDHGDERLVPLEEILDGLRGEPIETVRYSRSGWTPEFVPASCMPFMAALEWLLEHAPMVRRYSAHNVVVATKKS